MKAQLQPSALADTISWCARVLPARPQDPGQAGIRLSAAQEDGGTLTLSCFAYQGSASAAVPASTGEPGSAVVPARLLADIIRSLPRQSLTIEADTSRVVLTCGPATFTVRSFPAVVMPDVPALPTVAGRIGGEDLATAVGQVAIAASRDATLPALGCVFLNADGATLTLACTDRYRLAERQLTWAPEAGAFQASALIPARALADMTRPLTAAPDVAVALDPGKNGVGVAGVAAWARTATARLVAAEFPRYSPLLADAAAVTADLPRTQLAEAIKRVALVAEGGAAVEMSFGPGEVLIRAGSAHGARASESLGGDISGPFQAVLNPSYLLDGLGAVQGEAVRLAFTEPGKPVLLMAGLQPGEPGPRFRYLLMPVRKAI